MRESLRNRNGGQGLVEHAMVLPLLLLIFLAIFELGHVVFKYNTVANAAREGARAGVIQVQPDDLTKKVDEAYIEDIVVARGLALNLTDLDVQVTLTTTTVTVEVTHTATLMTGPIMDVMGGNSHVQLHTVATMNRE